jgi:hypothetical protein
MAFLCDQSTFAAEKSDQLIIINKSTNQLAFYDQGELVKEFSVATGRKPSYTPEGSFKLVNKIKNRPYYKEKIAGGDPKNPLGDRWLGINARETWGTTYAIHGNSDSKSIGTYASAGCIRMHNDEVRWLFEQVRVSTPVIIISSDLTFDQIAEANHYQLSSGVTKEVTMNILMDGETIKAKASSLLIDDIIFLPIRALEALGATISWEEKTKTVTVIKEDRVVILSNQSETVIVNGTSYKTKNQIRMINGRTMVPLSALSDIFGLSFEIDPQASTLSFKSI